MIAIKGIYHERTEDAPFIGALICSTECNFNCTDCCNEHLKNIEYYYMEDCSIINEVKKNLFNKGIILGGLEWTLQPNEMFRLIELALENNLKVILYTGLELNNLKVRFPKLFNLDIYIKYGQYKKNLKKEGYKVFSVKLASSNQNIIKISQNKN